MEGFLKFFGTGGARFVVSKQLRATGGLWLNFKNTNVYIDPGPGAIVKIRASRSQFDPASLSGIILTHKHMDHANDVNVLAESMTDGGFVRRGALFAPGDALEGEPVVYDFVRAYLKEITPLKEGGQYQVGDIPFSTPIRHQHPVETYGLIFYLNITIGLISDTRYFDTLPDYYPVDCLIINVLRSKPIGDHEIIEHLALNDVKIILERVRPKKAILTHFGMHIIQEKPYLAARRLSREIGIDVVAAYDGMKWEY